MSEQLIHVVDDDPAMRESMAFLLGSADLKARTYASGPEILEHQDRLTSGCIVTDVRMPQMNGLDLVRALKAKGVGLPVIVITGHGDVPLAAAAIREGVFDFIEKPFGDEVLIGSVRRALARDQRRGSGPQGEARKAKVALERLSARERDVLAGLVAGGSNKVIARDHGISPRTVEIYRANLMAKTGAGSLSELVRMAIVAELPDAI